MFRLITPSIFIQVHLAPLSVSTEEHGYNALGKRQQRVVEGKSQNT